MANFHWVGATGNTISKYDWNQATNWWVKDTGMTSGYDPNIPATAFRRASRTPNAGDYVYIGTELHCLSPLLFGGYSGNAEVHNGGNWGTGLTTGLTGGGVSVTWLTDVPAAGDSESVSFSLLAGLTNSPDSLFSNVDDLTLADYLLNVNPHSGYIGSTGAAYGTAVNPALYPFPYIGGGFTGNNLSWAYNQHRQSFLAFNKIGSSTYASRNAWVGGGVTSTGLVFDDRSARADLRVRLNNIGLFISSGVPASQSKTKAFEQKTAQMFVACDRLGGPYGNVIGSRITIDQPYKLGHMYNFFGYDVLCQGGSGGYSGSCNGAGNYGERKGNGLMQSLNVKGDCMVNFNGITAGYANLDIHASTRISYSALGGVGVVEKPWGSVSEPARLRYNSWPLQLESSITGGALSAIYGTSITGSVTPLYANQLALQSFNSLLTATDGISGAYANPYAPSILLGTYNYSGGTGPGTIITVPTVYAISPSTQKPYNSPNDKVWNIMLNGSSRIGNIIMQGGLLKPASWANPASEINIGNVDISQYGIVDFTTNPNLDAIFIGTLTGSNSSNYRVIGGINAIDETAKVYCSAGMKFVNTKVVGQGLIDNRTTKFGASNTSVFASNPNDKGDIVSFAGTPSKLGTEQGNAL